jgi:predicted enzyme related to lactoylglutathione lyase
MTRIDHPLVHLELHTHDLAAARQLYSELCRWREEPVRACSATYLALELGDGVGGGIVECPIERPLWLPYVQVEHIGAATQRARERGAAVLLGPREGPSGWRSVIATSAGGEIAFWQPKR